MNSKGTQPYIHMYPFSPKLPSHPGCHITLSRVPRSYFCFTSGPTLSQNRTARSDCPFSTSTMGFPRSKGECSWGKESVGLHGAWAILRRREASQGWKVEGEGKENGQGSESDSRQELSWRERHCLYLKQEPRPRDRLTPGRLASPFGMPRTFSV